MSWHASLPYGWMRSVYRAFRRTFFSKSRPDGEYIVISDTDVQELKALFGTRSYSPNWEFSYNKRGEDLNLARVIYYEHEDHPEIQWWQYHIRVWMVDGDAWIRAHFEAEPTEYPKPHLNGVGHNVRKGLSEVEQVLTDNNIRFIVEAWECADN